MIDDLGKDLEEGLWALVAPRYCAEKPLRAWYTEAKKAQWQSPRDIKAEYRAATILRNNRVVFNIKGNTYRLVIAVKYEFQIAYIRFIGTHAEYNKINAEEI